MAKHRLTEEIVESVLAGYMDLALTRLTDFDPLVVVMCVVAKAIKAMGGSMEKPSCRRIWLLTMRQVQANTNFFEHNRYIPCRYCDTAFEPVVDDALLSAFLKWYRSDLVGDAFLAIHRCPACGGQLAAEDLKKYKGDFHTPTPGEIQGDETWAFKLLDAAFSRGALP